MSSEFLGLSAEAFNEIWDTNKTASTEKESTYHLSTEDYLRFFGRDEDYPSDEDLEVPIYPCNGQ